MISLKNKTKWGSEYLPFLLVAVVAILYHIRIHPMLGDDLFFAQATESKGILAYLINRYQTWTSRFVIEWILVLLVKVPFVWRILDLLVFATLPIIIAQLLGGGKLMNWCSSIAVLLYPFHDMGSAGWITTTVNYFFPIWGMFFVALLLKKTVRKEPIRVWEAVAAVPVCLIASSHEQVAVILFVIFGLCLVYCRKEKIHPEKRGFLVSILMFVANAATLISIVLCPGNAGRNAVSIADLPIYETFHFGDKLYLGLLSVERVFIANADAVFVLVAALLSLLVYLKTQNYKDTLIASLPAMILFGHTVLLTAYPGLSGLFVKPGQITEWSWGALSTWLPMGYLLVTVAAMLYAFWRLFAPDLFEYFATLILLGCGFGAGAVLGFMATIYVSGERVYITFYFILLFVMLLCIWKQREKIEKLYRTVAGKMAVTWIALLCLVNIGFIFLSC